MRVRSLVLCVMAFAGAAAAASWRDARANGDTESTAQLYRSGTGFFIAQTGEMLTSAHVVRKCRRIEVWPQGAASGIAAVIATRDEHLDLAILSTNYRADRIAGFAIDPARKGSRVVTIGYGFTASAPLEPVFTRGRIDGLARSDGRDIAMLRARLYEGNSGGPVVDEEGRVIGMVIGRYASDPELGVAIRGSELARFVRAWYQIPYQIPHQIPYQIPHMATSQPARQDPEKYLSEISALIQCIGAEHRPSVH